MIVAFLATEALPEVIAFHATIAISRSTKTKNMDGLAGCIPLLCKLSGQ
jgi:hypothetical protein